MTQVNLMRICCYDVINGMEILKQSSKFVKPQKNKKKWNKLGPRYQKIPKMKLGKDSSW